MRLGVSTVARNRGSFRESGCDNAPAIKPFRSIDLRRDDMVCNIAQIQASLRMPSSRPRDNLSQDRSHHQQRS